MTLAADGRRYTRLPRLTQTRAPALQPSHFKAPSKAGRLFFLICEFYSRELLLPPHPPLSVSVCSESEGVGRRRTFLQGLEETSKEALKARLCWVVRMVRGLLGLRGSFPSSPLPGPPMPFSGLMSSSSSSLFSAGGGEKVRRRL